MRGVPNDALSIHFLAADLSGHLVLGRDWHLVCFISKGRWPNLVQTD
jgi:hypothetical protein